MCLKFGGLNKFKSVRKIEKVLSGHAGGVRCVNPEILIVTVKNCWQWH